MTPSAGFRKKHIGGNFEDYKEAKRAREEERRAIREEERHYNWRPGFREQSASPRED